MRKLPYIEPTIRTIAGTFITVFGVLLIMQPGNASLWYGFLFFVSLNLFQSGFTRFCLMEKILKRVGFRSEMDEIRDLSKAQANYLDTLNLLNEVVIEISLEGQLARLSERWNKLLGSEKVGTDDYIGTRFVDYLEKDAQEAVLQLLKDIKPDDIANIRFRMLREDNVEHWVEGTFTLYQQADKQHAIRGVLRDVTESYLQQQNIAHMAMHDTLTNLPNRLLLEDRMEHMLQQAKRAKNKAAVLFIDLDNFKQVNDLYGHKVGDQLLIAVSGVLQEAMRKSDTLARWGGDEFVVLLPGLQSLNDAIEVAEKLMERMHLQLVVEELDTMVTLSIGIALYPDDADTAESLLIQADKALFFAKSQGRNNIQVYSKMEKSDLGFKDVNLTSSFSAAVKQGLIQVHYQPLIDGKTGKLVSIEALARWHDDKFGWVSPATFIPMAENLGLMTEVGHQVLEQALSHFSQYLQSSPDLSLSVNISNRQLFAKNFVESLRGLLDRYAIKPEQLRLEITESISLMGISNAKECLKQLSDEGFILSLDDFGTGFSSLSLLHELPVDELKIDISFVRRIKTREGHIMVRTITDMGHSMHLSLVAEGVEDLETADMLRELGVGILQGYYFSKPLPKEDCIKFIQNNLESTKAQGWPDTRCPATLLRPV